jgi:RNA polymerase sigma factor (TIGR02999 family)
MAANLTLLLEGLRRGEEEAGAELYALAYGELHRIARAQRRNWSGNETINTTALVHEAFLKLARGAGDWKDRAHFLSVAARAMRHVLINYAAASQAARRGGGATPVPLDAAHAAVEATVEDVLALHRALERLSQRSERQVRVVECRFFAGLSVAETAEVLGVSRETVKRDWTLASAWLRLQLAEGADAGDGTDPLSAPA